MEKLVHALEAAMAEDIKQLPWMSRPDTKVEAEKKLNAIKDKIGYPDKWRDYIHPRREARRPPRQRASAPRSSKTSATSPSSASPSTPPSGA